MSTSDNPLTNPFAAQDALYLRNLSTHSDPTNDMTVQSYRGCVGISCTKSTLLFAFLVEQIGSGIGQVGVARLIRTAKVVPMPGPSGVMVFWRDIPWKEEAKPAKAS